MEWITPQILMQFVSIIAVGGAVWGAIRTDIKHLHRDIENHRMRIDKNEDRALDAYNRLNQRITEAHQRIDAATGTNRRNPV